MSMSVIVLGAGGHAKVLLNALVASSTDIAGVADSDSALWGTSLLGVPVFAEAELADRFPAAEIQLVNGLGSVGSLEKRQQLFEKFKDLGYIFSTVVHPSAVVASDVSLGEGAQIMAGTVIQPGSCIGCNSIINTSASVDHDCDIGDHVHIAPGVTLSGGVTIGTSSHIGSGATVIQGVTIGCGCLIAAGTVVVKDISDGAMVRGVPAREFL